MSVAEQELEKRLSALPDADPDSIWCAMFRLKHLGLVDEALKMLDDTPDATTETVITFREAYCGEIEVCSDDGTRVPVSTHRLRFTSGMRAILAEMKGKILKSYQYTSIGEDSSVADRNMRLNLGQHAVDLNCYDFTFDVCGEPVNLGAMHCERMNLRDDFRPWSDDSYRAYAVGERITDVELIADHVEILRGLEADVLDVDVAVVVRTAHATYTFAREPWCSTGIRVIAADNVVIPYEPNDIDVGWLGLPNDYEIPNSKASRTIERLT